jgi:CubicO group peptidase (beta-lactamase class C family)
MKFTTWTLIFLLLLSCNSSPTKVAVINPPDSNARFVVDLHYNPSKKDKSIDTFFQHLHSHRGFNGNVLIAKNGKIIYENTFGFANFLKKDSLKIDSKFQLASISKQFTALAILILRDEGKLKLSQLVTDFFPKFPYAKISLHLLLSHRSGLPNYQYYSEKTWKNKRKAMTNLDLMDMLTEYKPSPYSSPDTHFFYNNVNYAVLAAIVEKISGESLENFMKKKVFDPIGMFHTRIYSKAIDTLNPTNLIGYDRSFRRRDDPNWLDGIVGDKGVYSTVEDMFIWDQMLYSNKIISQKTLQEAFTGKNRDMKGHFNYGYGWRLFYPGDHKLDSLTRESKGKIVYHTGWWHGYKNIFVRDLDHHNTVIILSNLFNSSINDLDPLYRLLNIPVLRHSAY